MTQEHPERPPAESRREQAAACLRRHGFDDYAEELEQVAELPRRWQDDRCDVADRDTATESAAVHRNGVMCGIDWCADELAVVLADDE